MSKWIAEFELEDGDRMPKHMDLNYKGAKIDFYCRPLEQESFKSTVEIDLYSVIKQKYIERDVIDKVRAEIKSLERFEIRGEVTPLVNVNRVLEIIDKAESEVDNENVD